MSINTKCILGSLLQFVGIFIISLIFERLIEVLIIIPLFFIYRSKYDKTFHAYTILQCTICTLIMFVIICLISLPINESILFSVILCFITTEVLYYIKDYMDLKKVKKFKIYKGMSKEILEQKCKMFDLNDIETKILILYYCDGLKRWQIGNILNYSEQSISLIKKKALDKLV